MTDYKTHLDAYMKAYATWLGDGKLYHGCRQSAYALSFKVRYLIRYLKESDLANDDVSLIADIVEEIKAKDYVSGHLYCDRIRRRIQGQD